MIGELALALVLAVMGFPKNQKVTSVPLLPTAVQLNSYDLLLCAIYWRLVGQLVMVRTEENKKNRTEKKEQTFFCDAFAMTLLRATNCQYSIRIQHIRETVNSRCVQVCFCSQ